MKKGPKFKNGLLWWTKWHFGGELWTSGYVNCPFPLILPLHTFWNKISGTPSGNNRVGGKVAVNTYDVYYMGYATRVYTLLKKISLNYKHLLKIQKNCISSNLQRRHFFSIASSFQRKNLMQHPRYLIE